MEFYQNRGFYICPCQLFQFPTGWNSTLCALRRRGRRRLFQFPTGWNSTHFTPLGIEIYTCFNSQRDGILQKVFEFFKLRLRVSIPNGMEFYSKLLMKKPSLTSVSIPNGMEFYYAIFRINVRQRRVSIPNGMEFYPTTAPNQTKQQPFQFPTGWNSTQR